MFNSITGTITGKFPQTLFLYTGLAEHGLEWDICVPDSSLDFLPPIGETARVFIWHYHTENSEKFFGFASVAERSLFLDLMKVEGIGPKAAVKILSSISAEQLASALDGEDLARLEAISGIGKKTAQKMLLTLKGKLTLYENAPSTLKQTTKWQDVCAALIQMGYEKKAVEETLLQLEKSLDSSTTKKEQEEFLFKNAIIALAQN